MDDVHEANAKRPAPHRRRARAGLPAEFQRFWLAAAVSNVGDGIRIAALPLLALELTDDARLIAGVTVATFVPWIVVGPLTGAVVDRRNRRTLMLIGQIGRGVAVLLLAAAVSAGRANIAQLYAAAFAIGMGETIVDSAAQAAIPQFVDDRDLERANGRIIVAVTLFDQVVGVALGALLFSRASSLPFYVDAATFALGALLLTTIRQPMQHDRTVSSTVRADIAEGLKFLLHHRLLRGLALSVATTNVALHMGLGVIVVLVVNEIGATEATYGIVLAIGALGGVVGSMIAGKLAELFTPRRVLMFAHLPFVVASTIHAAATRAWMVSVAFALSSLALVVYKIVSQALRQRVTPDRLLGRVVAAFRIFGLGGPVVGAPIGGVLAEAFDVRSAFAVAAVVMVLAWVLMLAALRHYAADPAVGPDSAPAASTSDR